MTRSFLLFIAALTTGFGCAAGGPHRAADGPDPGTAVRYVLHRDVELAEQRNHRSVSAPVSEAVREYTEGLDELDLTGTPPDFRRALEHHRDAWADLVPVLERWADERGEMHEVLDRITAAGGQESESVRAGLGRVWSTWAEVEAAAERVGVDPSAP